MSRRTVLFLIAFGMTALGVTNLVLLFRHGNPASAFAALFCAFVAGQALAAALDE